MEEFLKIDEEKLRLIKEYHLSIDEYFYMWSRYWANGWTQIYAARVDVSILESLDYINSAGVSARGREVVEHIEGYIMEDSRFEEFWQLYPDEDGNEHFPSTRKLKLGKPRAKGMYTALAKKYTPQVVIDTLKNDLEFKRQGALAKKPMDSPWRYMKKIENWLRDFEPIITEAPNKKENYGGNRHKLE